MLDSISDAISFAFAIVFPNLALMGLGFLLNKHAILNTNFVDTASKLVFSYALPCLLFFSVIDSHMNDIQHFSLISAGIVTTLLLFFGATIYAKHFDIQQKDKGVFVQGIFRSNMAIIGLSVITNAYGAIGASVGALYMGVLTILFNILSVIALFKPQMDTPTSISAQIYATGKHIASNPLILALVIAFLYKAISLPTLPQPIVRTGELLANITLPLALICAGATLNLKSMLKFSGISMQASLGRTIIAPMCAIGIGLLFGLSQLEFGVLFIMVASPVAAASYVMAKAMGGNSILAANILAFTTVANMFVLAIGMGILRLFALV